MNVSEEDDQMPQNETNQVRNANRIVVLVSPGIHRLQMILFDSLKLKMPSFHIALDYHGEQMNDFNVLISERFFFTTLNRPFVFSQ